MAPSLTEPIANQLLPPLGEKYCQQPCIPASAGCQTTATPLGLAAESGSVNCPLKIALTASPLGSAVSSATAASVPSPRVGALLITTFRANSDAYRRRPAGSSLPTAPGSSMRVAGGNEIARSEAERGQQQVVEAGVAAGIGDDRGRAQVGSPSPCVASCVPAVLAKNSMRYSLFAPSVSRLPLSVRLPPETSACVMTG